MFKSDEFIEDMRHADSIGEVLEKHDVSLVEAIDILQKISPRKRKEKTSWNAKTGEKYIAQIPSGAYIIRKSVNGKMRYFGKYDNLNDAVKVRDYLLKHGWYPNRVKSIRKKLGV